ncbi:hypothetical protein MRX96_034427 [Rhipicephalus microplus]
MKYLHAVHENRTGPQSVAGGSDQLAARLALSPLFRQSRRLLAPACRGGRPTAFRQRPGEGSVRLPLIRMRLPLPTRLQLPSVHAADRQKPRRRVQLAPTPIASTPARKLRKATEVTQPEGENPSTSKEVAAKAPRMRRTKRSRSSSSESPNYTASEGPKRRPPKKVSRGRSRHSSRSSYAGPDRKARTRCSSASSEASHPRKRRTRSRRHVRSITSSSTKSRRSKRGKKRGHTRSRSSSRHGGRHGKARMAPSSRSSSVRGRRTRTGKTSKDRKKK